MNGLFLPVSCPRCGGPVRLVNATASLGTQSLGIVRCDADRYELSIEITMRPHSLTREDRRTSC